MARTETRTLPEQFVPKVHVSEDEADILISIRREKEKRISFADILRKHGHALEGGPSVGGK
jgi:hypothetical protein